MQRLGETLVSMMAVGLDRSCGILKLGFKGTVQGFSSSFREHSEIARIKATVGLPVAATALLKLTKDPAVFSLRSLEQRRQDLACLLIQSRTPFDCS
jgi:hypothetical protein